MTETIRRSGWQQAEVDLLWKEIRAAAENGDTLRDVFERMGRTLGRKPNSVRNYYYIQLRDQGGESLRRAAPFETFTPEEVHILLRRLLIARGQGRSVRACVTDLSNGDKTLMLRHQNEYRSILRKKPQLIDQVCRELAQEGLPCPQAQAVLPADTDDPAVRVILSALESLARRARQNPAETHDRLKVQRDLMSMRLEDLQSAVQDLIALCKDYLGETEETPAFREALAGRLARPESLAGS